MVSLTDVSPKLLINLGAAVGLVNLNFNSGMASFSARKNALRRKRTHFDVLTNILGEACGFVGGNVTDVLDV